MIHSPCPTRDMGDASRHCLAWNTTGPAGRETLAQSPPQRSRYRQHFSLPDNPMAIIGIGVDVLHTPRILGLIQRQGASRFARRILSDKELAVWDAIPAAQQARRARFLAVRYDSSTYGLDTLLTMSCAPPCRWSVKEAVYKAVFPLIRPTWREFTFHSLSDDGRVKPWLEYHPHIQANTTTLGTIHSSVSHDGDYVLTSVLVEGP